MFIADLKNNLFSQCLNGSLTFVVIKSCQSHSLSSKKLVLKLGRIPKPVFVQFCCPPSGTNLN